MQDFGGTARKAENKIGKSKIGKLYIETTKLLHLKLKLKEKKKKKKEEKKRSAENQVLLGIELGTFDLFAFLSVIFLTSQ